MNARRIKALNSEAPRSDGRYVLYWMEHSQRAGNNPALERAVGWANECSLPLFVLYVVDPTYLEGNARHFTFMLEGVKEALADIKKRGAHVALRRGSPPNIASKVARDAAVVVTDRGYLSHLKAWRAEVAEECGCLMEMVEGDAIVPVEEASDKRETAARTIRPKLKRAVGDFIDLEPERKLAKRAKGLRSDEDETIGSVARFVESLDTDMSVAPVDHTVGGLSKARERLDAFLSDDLAAYGEGRSDIVDRHVSVMSPYLHLGQISPVEIYQAVEDAKRGGEADKASFIDEMLVRRELAINYVHHTPNYASYQALPEWARETLAAHKGDKRETVYSKADLEAGRTDDPYWNAAMREMRLTGYLHNHLRMYWGKRIIGWMRDPKAAFQTALALNNKYFLDGRDANSYANIAWLFGLHDRGWPERDVYGKVRIMLPSGLKRKFDVDAYVKWANDLPE